MKRKSKLLFKRSSLALLLAGAVVAPVHATSLWRSPANREQSMCADHKASRIGDILTVVVQESATAQSSLRTKTDKSSSAKTSVNSFFFTPSGSSAGTHNGVLPNLDLGGQTSFSGGGQISNSQSIVARAAVTVIDVLPNGNLVIEGSRLVSFSGEKQYAVLRGMVRPEDIQSGNTVVSTDIADARVEYISKGSISTSQRKGWLTRIYDMVNPF